MEKCFRCKHSDVIPQMSEIPYKGIKKYTVNVEAMVCQNCGFIYFNDDQAEAYGKAIEPFFNEYCVIHQTEISPIPK